MVKSVARWSSVAAAALLALPAARAAEKEPGVLWESTVEMKMVGFSMPPTRSTFCAPKAGIDQPPTGGEKQEKDCKITDVKHVGNKMTWKMECTGKNAMTGEGEMTQGKDRFEGKMTMSSKAGAMEMAMSGKKLGTECDAGEVKRQVAAAQKQADDYQAQAAAQQEQACDKAVDDMLLEAFQPPIGWCKEPAQLAKLCERARTRAGFLKLSERESSLKAATKLCKLDVEKTRAKLCEGAAADVKSGGKTPPADALEFLPENCPDEAKAIAKKECTGRSYTGTPGTWRGFCAQVRQAGLSEAKPAKGGDAAEDDEEEKSPQDKAVDKVKKGLKGLFGG